MSGVRRADDERDEPRADDGVARGQGLVATAPVGMEPRGHGAMLAVPEATGVATGADARAVQRGALIAPAHHEHEWVFGAAACPTCHVQDTYVALCHGPDSGRGCGAVWHLACHVGDRPPAYGPARPGPVEGRCARDELAAQGVQRAPQGLRPPGMRVDDAPRGERRVVVSAAPPDAELPRTGAEPGVVCVGAEDVDRMNGGGGAAARAEGRVSPVVGDDRRGRDQGALGCGAGGVGDQDVHGEPGAGADPAGDVLDVGSPRTLKGAGELGELMRLRRPRLVVVAERRGKCRDRAEAQGVAALSMDVLPCESPTVGWHYEGTYHDILPYVTVDDPLERTAAFLPCEQQTVGMGVHMASLKAADGRMFFGIMQWVRGWTVPSRLCVAEHPDSYVVDVYDAPYIRTSYTEWGSNWHKTLLLFVRGAAFPTPTHELSEGTLDWHRRSTSGLQRDQTPDGLADTVAAMVPDDDAVVPDWEVERERVAAAFYLVFGFVFDDYDNDAGWPSDPETRTYLRSRGTGDMRRPASWMVPHLLREEADDACATRATPVALKDKLAGVRPPVVTPRAMTLGRAVRRLIEREVVQATTRAAPQVCLSTATGGLLAVVPAMRVGGQMWFLLPAEGGGLVCGVAHPDAAGETSAARKAGTAAAEALVDEVFGDARAACEGVRVRVAPVRYLRGGERHVSVMAAWVPPSLRQVPRTRELGLLWTRMCDIDDAEVRLACQMIRHRADGWRSPQRPWQGDGVVGAVSPVTVDKGSLRGTTPTNVALARARLQRDMRVLRNELLAAAAREPHIAPQLHHWAERAELDDELRAPPSVEAHSVLPPASRWSVVPFSRRCAIPKTEAMPIRWPPPRWPAGVPRPTSAEATFKPVERAEVEGQMRSIGKWSAARIGGRDARRPAAKAWSDRARLPWLRGRAMLFASGRCELLGAGGPAFESTIEKPAALSLFAGFKHRRLVSYMVHGVRAADTLEFDTALAPNLLSMYDVPGGADAIANEQAIIKARGWVLSSAGYDVGDVGAVGGGDEGAGGEEADEPLGKPRLLSSPHRKNPRGMQPRKDGGPPRGVAEGGFPRVDMYTEDGDHLVDSFNNSSGDRVGRGGPDLEAFPLKEGKPTSDDACTGMVILSGIAQILGVSLLIRLFDYKYFFHHLVWEAAELWKMGFEVPARRPRVGGAHPTLLDWLIEMVMAMGWTRASLIAQDLANALVWRQAMDTDELLEPLIEKWCQEFPAFAEIWKVRRAIPHDDYGTHARVVESMQYTDDEFTCAVGPLAMAAATVAFCRMIGPPLYASADAADAARGTIARHRALVRGDALPRRMKRRCRGNLRVVVDDACGSDCHVYDMGEPAPGAVPFAGGTPERRKTAMACLLACGRDAVEVEEVAELRGLRVLPAQARVARADLWPWMDTVMARVWGEGLDVALRCRCPVRALKACACAAVCAHIEQQMDIADDVERGPPADPVCAETHVQATGLNLEAAKSHKWHLGGAQVWIGKGFDANLLLVWVPQAKAAAMLHLISVALQWRLPVSEYRSLYGQLNDVVIATGGGWYRMKGMAAPLQVGAEIDDGPSTHVCERKQLKARLAAWRRVLAQCPGSSMLAVMGEPARPVGKVVWEVGGDAALEKDRRKDGVGALFYGLWWRVHLDQVDEMALLPISALELIETGLGIVMVGAIIGDGAWVRVVSDAFAAVATLRARMPDGRRARDAKSDTLAAIHQFIMELPEWRLVKEVEQQYGETLLLHDAASRGYEEVIRDVCAAVGVTPRRVDPVPERGMEYLRAVVQVGRAAMRGDPDIPLAPNEYGVEAIEYMMEGGLLGFLEQLREAGDGDAALQPAARGRGVAAVSGASSPDAGRGAAWDAPGEQGDDLHVRRRRARVCTHDEHGAPDRRAVDKRRAMTLRAAAVPDAGVPSAEPRAHAMARVVARLRPEPAKLVDRGAGSRPPEVPIVARKAVSAAQEALRDARQRAVERQVQNVRCNEDGLGVTGDVDGMLGGVLHAASEAGAKRFAPNTHRQDDSYWGFWTVWCAALGTPSWRTNRAANNGTIPHLHDREVAIALGAFMTWVRTNPELKVDSMMARLRGVARRHVAAGLTFVSLTQVVTAAQGVIRELVDAEGPEVLIPKSAEPFDASEIIGMLSLPEGTRVVVGGVVVTVGDNLEWQGTRVFIALFATMGCRKEAVALGPDEAFGPRKLSLWHITYKLDGLIVRLPTTQQLQTRVTWGTVVYITPCPCKNDVKGDKYGNSPVPSAWHPTRPICFAREVVKYEIMRRVECTREARKAAPLVLGPGGVSWTKAALDAYFKALIAFVVSPTRAKQLTVHSFRVWLACALLAAGATPEQIMLLLRWSSDAARKLYARAGLGSQAAMLDTAVDMPIDSVRSHTLFAAATAGGRAPRQEEAEAARAVEEARRLVEEAHAVRTPLCSRAELGVEIDDHAQAAAVAAAVPRLIAAAMRADEKLAKASGVASDDDDD